MTTRFELIPDEALTEDQRRFAEDTPMRRGPYVAYQRSPHLWRSLQPPRVYFRSQGNFDKMEQELAIIVTARRWGNSFAFEGHAGMAREAGLDEAVINDIAHDRVPSLPEGPAAVHDFCKALAHDGKVDDETFERVKARYTEQGVVDLTAMVGYYTLVSMLLNVDGQTSREPLPF